jgi:exoribonuclease-2
MLPKLLTEGLLSLKSQAGPRPAWTLFIDLTEDLRLLRSSFHQSLVEVDRHMTFQEADLEMKGGGGTEAGAMLTELSRISDAFLKKRLGQGGFVFNLPQRNIRVDRQGNISFSLTTFESPSYSMLGELMIAANNQAAVNLKANNAPCPYRYQLLFKPRGGGGGGSNTPPADPKELFTWNLTLRRRLGRSGVSLQPYRHRGLGLQAYTYYTAPMRRYFDILVHRQTASVADKRGPFYSAEAMEAEALFAQKALKAVHRVQGQRERYWLLMLLRKKIGETFKALAYERRGDRVHLCLTDYMLDVEQHNLPQSVQPGVEIGLRLTACDPRTGMLVFQPE